MIRRLPISAFKDMLARPGALAELNACAGVDGDTVIFDPASRAYQAFALKFREWRKNPAAFKSIVEKPVVQAVRSAAGRYRIVHANIGGIFSNLNNVMTIVHLYPDDDLAVDWSTRNIHFRYGSNRDGDVWSKLFYPFTDREVLNPIHIRQYVDWRFTATFVADYYRRDRQWRQGLNAGWKKIRLLPSMQVLKDNVLAGMPPRPRVGVHVRHGGHAVEQPRGKMPSLLQVVEMVKATMSHIRARSVVLATDNDETVEFFRRIFGESLYFGDVTRAKTSKDPQIHQSADASLKLAYDVFSDAFRLASCDYFVHAVSNVATGVLYMAPRMPHVFVEDGTPLVFRED